MIPKVYEERANTGTSCKNVFFAIFKHGAFSNALSETATY